MQIRYVNRIRYMHIENLEKITSHLNRTALIAMAARPGLGKTTLAINIAIYEAERYNKNVVFFELEMLEKHLYVNYNIQDKSSIHIIDDASITVSQMKEKLQKLEDLDLVIIDYFELIQSESEEKRRFAQFFDIGIGLHNLSRELNIPILLLCQLPRNIDYRTDKRPNMQDFRNYSCLEQHVDIEILLYRNSYPKSNEPSHYHFDPIIECNIAKNRYGETETILLNCRLDFKVLQSNDES